MRFVVFAAIVLGVPSGLFVLLEPSSAEEAGPAMLALILLPSLAGALLARGLPREEVRRRSVVGGVGLAVGVTAAVVALSAVTGVATGAVRWLGTGTIGAAAGTLAASVVTSTLEELGWAAGGLRVARASLGRHAGLVALSVVWALWHPVVAAFAPAETVAMMFPRGDMFEPGPLIGFFVGLWAYRLLLTELRDQSASVWPAVAAHVTGNVLLGAPLGGGYASTPPEGPWWGFPSATGVFFAVAALVATWLVRRSAPRAP